MDILVMLDEAPGHSPILAHVNSVPAPMDADRPWRDVVSGQLVTRDVEIPLERLRATAGQLLVEFGTLIRRLVAGLSMPDWPEGARRAITVSLGPIVGLTVPVFAPLESILDRLREAEGLAFEYDGD
jgi:hypothetical protein